MSWRVADGVFTEEIDGERIVLDSAGNRYLTLNETGSTIYDLATDGADLDAIVGKLTSSWEISESDARRTARDFLRKLVSAKILVQS